MARTCAQDGTEKDSQEGLRWNPPGKRKQGRPKITLSKTFEGDLKKLGSIILWKEAVLS